MITTPTAFQRYCRQVLYRCWNPLTIGRRCSRGIGGMMSRGLYQVRNRQYHSVLASWMERDPTGGSALYCYVKNNPINGVDPLGLQEIQQSQGPGEWVPLAYGILIRMRSDVPRELVELRENTGISETRYFSDGARLRSTVLGWGVIRPGRVSAIDSFVSPGNTPYLPIRADLFDLSDLSDNKWVQIGDRIVQVRDIYVPPEWRYRRFVVFPQSERVTAATLMRGPGQSTTFGGGTSSITQSAAQTVSDIRRRVDLFRTLGPFQFSGGVGNLPSILHPTGGHHPSAHIQIQVNR